MNSVRIVCLAVSLLAGTAMASPARGLGLLPDGRSVSPAGFTIPVEGFSSSQAMSPDGKWLAVLSQDGGAIDVLSVGEDARMVDRLAAPWASGMTWTKDGLYVTRGYSGTITRYSYNASLSQDAPVFTKRSDIHVGGLLNGIAEDPASHHIVVARTAGREVDLIDDRTSGVLHRFAVTGQPFSVGFAGSDIIATLYDRDRIDVWRAGSSSPTEIQTGPHPTEMLVDGSTAYIANADGHDVAVVDLASLSVTRRFDLSLDTNPYAGQTPAGMALSADRKTLFVAESGFNDVAVVDTGSGKVAARIPTGWYPTSVLFKDAPTIDNDPRAKGQLWILSAQGYGPQPDPGSEWNGWYTGLVEHLVVESNRFAEWTADVANDNHFAIVSPPPSQLPPIKHIVFIVEENKHFDEVFGDEPNANTDHALLLYGRKYTPNAHALAERYALFDDFRGNGEKSDLGHAWTTQGMTNDYHERNVHTPDDPASKKDVRVPYSIWPFSEAGEDALTPAQMNFDWFADLTDLPKGPRVNVSAIFGPRGELVDELQRKGLSYRVYGEQMTMLRDGRIAPGLSSHADRDYPGAHIDYGVLDTMRAKLFLDDVAAHGFAAYSYLTLPTDHTAGTKAGYYTPASYVANNDEALGQIIEGLSKRPDWRDTVVFVTMDDPQGTGDHVDSHRMPAFAIGPYVHHGFVDHTRYSIPSVLRTVEVLYGLDPLNMYDAEATPVVASFASQPDAAPFTALPETIPMTKNPGKATSLSMVLDGPESARIPMQEWASVKGVQSVAAHERYLRSIGQPVVAEQLDL